MSTQTAPRRSGGAGADDPRRSAQHGQALTRLPADGDETVRRYAGAISIAAALGGTLMSLSAARRRA